MRFSNGLRPRIVEALIGLLLAVLVIFVAWAASGQVPFVYRGL